MNSLFKVSAKNHAGMILMTILARQESCFAADDAYVSLKDVAKEMGLSQKFLEEIAAALKKAGLIKGRKGPGGGYRLAKDAKQISAEDILVALEGAITPISCEGAFCPVAQKCQSKTLWGFLYKDLINSLKSKSLEEIAN